MILCTMGPLDRTEQLPGRYLVPAFTAAELPFDVSAQSGCGGTAEDEVSHHLPEDGQGPLDSVVNGGQKNGSQLYDERKPGVGNRFSGFDTGRLLVNLDDCLVAYDLDDLSHKFLVANMHDIVHPGRDPDGGHDRSGNPVNYTLFSGHSFILCFV